LRNRLFDLSQDRLQVRRSAQWWREPAGAKLNPKENLALKSIDHVRQKLHEAILYIERNPEVVKSITSFPYLAKSF
jgi:hypothetical protein